MKNTINYLNVKNNNLIWENFVGGQPAYLKLRSMQVLRKATLNLKKSLIRVKENAID